MPPATSFVTTGNCQATSDPRFDMRLTEKFDDDDATSVGWAWVAAILIAGTLIVSGYLDQASANTSGQTVAASGDKYANNTADAQTTYVNVRGTELGHNKGYSSPSPQ